MSSRLHPRFGEAADRIQRIFGSRRRKWAGPREVKGLRRDLEGLLGERDTWDTAVLRELLLRMGYADGGVPGCGSIFRLLRAPVTDTPSTTGAFNNSGPFTSRGSSMCVKRRCGWNGGRSGGALPAVGSP